MAIAWLLCFAGTTASLTGCGTLLTKRWERAARLGRIGPMLSLGSLLVLAAGLLSMQDRHDIVNLQEPLPPCLLLAIVSTGFGSIARKGALREIAGKPSDDAAPAPPLELSKGTATYLVFIGVVLLLFPLSAVAFKVPLLVEWNEMQHWSKSSAVIEHADFHGKSHTSGTGKSRKTTVTYKVSALYRYQVDGRSYSGTRVSLYDKGDSSPSFHKNLHADLDEARRNGTPWPCYVNPRNPSDSVLMRDLRPGKLAVDVIAGLLLGALGVWLIRWSLAKRRQAVMAERALRSMA